VYLAYVYKIENYEIIDKIVNLQGIDTGKDVDVLRGDTASCNVAFGVYDYIVLDQDTPNKQKGEIIDLTGLVDLRDEVLLDATEYFKKKLKEAQEKLEATKTELDDTKTQLSTAKENLEEIDKSLSVTQDALNYVLMNTME
jgi:ElaB/YqjD/DUF883 family membrane-anchored ribosome-binding protein